PGRAIRRRRAGHPDRTEGDMGIQTSVRTCLARYASFTGRAARPEFWWFFLFVLAGGIAFSFVDASVFGIDPRTGEPRTVLAGIFALATFVPLLSAGWRRMHDTGRSGWYLLLPALFSLAFAAVT